MTSLGTARDTLVGGAEPTSWVIRIVARNGVAEPCSSQTRRIRTPTGSYGITAELSHVAVTMP